MLSKVSVHASDRLATLCCDCFCDHALREKGLTAKHAVEAVGDSLDGLLLRVELLVAGFASTFHLFA